MAFIFAIMVAGYAGADLPVLGSVVEGSAAEAAGMQAGDKILRFNSKINLAREISLEMALNKTGESVKVVYERDGQEYETTLTRFITKKQVNIWSAFRIMHPMMRRRGQSCSVMPGTSCAFA